MARTKVAALSASQRQERLAARRKRREQRQLDKIATTFGQQMEIEDDEDGGVALGQDDVQSLQLLRPPDNGKARSSKNYHQRPFTTLDVEGANDFWQLPVKPIHVKAADLKFYGITEKSAKLYHRCCFVITNFWQCDPGNCLPNGVQQRTLYSLAMLRQLRRLANVTKNDHSLALSLMLEAWQQRTAHLEGVAEPNGVYIVKTFVDADRAAENRIEENAYGLTVDDVAVAVRNISARQGTVNLVHKSMREAQQADTATKVTDRRRAKARAQAASLNNPDQNTNRFSALEHQFVLPIRTRPTSTTTADDDYAFVQAPPKEGTTSDLSGQDKENYKQMSKLMNNMGVSYSVASKRARHKRLAAGGLSRRAAGGPLPSERIDFNNLSASDPTTPSMSRDELAQLGQQAFPD